MEGNARFVAGSPRSRPTVDLVRKLASGQSPYATVVACADSRVPVEILFDHDPGEIFVVRLAGNFLSDAALGSVEYAVEVLKSPLVMVLGHTSCGAVQAAVECVRNDKKALPGHIQMLADALIPAARATQGRDGDWWHNAVIENVRMTVEKLKSSEPIMRGAMERGAVQIVGGVYDLRTGAVNLVHENTGLLTQI
jgi:carbonic anhydrase